MKFIPTQGQALLVRDCVSHYSDMRIRGDNKKTTRNNENNIKAACGWKLFKLKQISTFD